VTGGKTSKDLLIYGERVRSVILDGVGRHRDFGIEENKVGSLLCSDFHAGERHIAMAVAVFNDLLSYPIDSKASGPK